MAGNLFTLFLGSVPAWYKNTILVFLLINPLVLFSGGAVVAGWVLVLEFIFTLAMALRCYPLQPGGLLALEAILLGMAQPATVYAEVSHNLPVLLLLMFMVAGIFFMQELLLSVFTWLLLSVKRKWLLSLLFCAVSALLSAFLDALTVTAVLITVCGGFYAVYHASISSAEMPTPDTAELEEFRAFLRSLVMHALMGTAMGGVATLVGEPQNLLIGETMGWHFMDFMHVMSPISLPVLGTGLLMVVVLEKTRRFGYGARLPEAVRDVLQQHAEAAARQHDWRRPLTLLIQSMAGLLLIAALTFHVAEVGLVGLALLVLLTAFTGVVDERRIAHAFEEAMPFTALLVVFFAIVAVIQQNELFTPVIHWVLGFDGRTQLTLLYAVNGLLSSVSDNVFVATVYIQQVHAAFLAHAISREQFETFAVAINVGTNIPSVATPNGQAAFLFLLTSGVAPLIRLSYVRMLRMALPYTIVLTGVGLLALLFLV
ncbi:MAG: sodium/proton antiporter NhaB [Gammaproteobacteria bacterium]|nr:sodium/proton antiporter NhaB [Gammaproteobacteria bacterium]